MGELLKFFTMSFKDDIFDLKEANNEFNKFIKRLEYHIKRKVHYTVIARFQDGKRPGGKLGGRDGVIHYHLLFYDLPYVPHGELTGIWGRGFVWINAVDDVDNIGVYMVEGYMGKEMDDDRLNGQKHYWSSRGLVKPLVIYGSKDLSASLGIQDREPVYRKTFTSDYVGVVDYEQYNLKREGKVYARKRKSDQQESADHREAIMERLGPGWVWCLCCERVYHREEVRWDPENEIYMCAYGDCDGDALFDAWDYGERRVTCGSPEVTEKGVIYPLYK